MNSELLLSICIPTYNRGERLDLLVKSLASQIVKSGLQSKVEIVISDNYSSDETQKIGSGWEARHSFIRYFRNEWNIGGDPNQILAAERGVGKFAWVLGDDDQIREDAISKIVGYLVPGVTQLFLDFRCMSLQGDCLAPSRLHDKIPDHLTTVQFIRRVGLVSVYALISSHVFDREMFLAIDRKALLEVAPWYTIAIAMIVAFSDKECVLVREVLLDYTAGNDRLPSENAGYVRVLGLLNTFRFLEETKKIDTDFLFGCCETGAGDIHTLKNPHYLREELYGNLVWIASYWAMPGRADWTLLCAFIKRGPGFAEVRHHLRGYFTDDFDSYRTHRKPTIHYWHGKASFPELSVLLSSDLLEECERFDSLMSQWPERFAHESILTTRIAEAQISFEYIDVLMAPFEQHRSPAAAINSGFRKVQASRVLILSHPSLTVAAQLIEQVDQWTFKGGAPDSCLIFNSMDETTGEPRDLIGLYVDRRELIDLGGFENFFESWDRERLLSDAGFRLQAEAWAVKGGPVSAQGANQWFARHLPGWMRLLRTIRKRPLSEHGLNINLRHNLKSTNRKK